MNGEIYFDKNGQWGLKPVKKSDQKRKNALQGLQEYFNIACAAYDRIYKSFRGEGEIAVPRFKLSLKSKQAQDNKKASDMAQCIENFLKFIIYYYDYKNDTFAGFKKIKNQIELKLRELFKDEDKINDYKSKFGVTEDYIKDVFNNHHIHYIFTEFIPENIQVLIKYKLLTCATTGANKPQLYSNEDIILLKDKEKYQITYDIATLEKILFDNQNAGVSGRYPTPVLFDNEGLRRVMDAVELITEYLTEDFDYKRKEIKIDELTIKNYSTQLEKLIKNDNTKQIMLDDLIKAGIYEEHLTQLTEFELYTLIKEFSFEEVKEIINIYNSNSYDVNDKNCYCFLTLLIFLKNGSNQGPKNKVDDEKIKYDTETINRLYAYYEKISDNTLFLTETDEKISLKDQIIEKKESESKQKGISIEQYSYIMDYIDRGKLDKSSEKLMETYMNLNNRRELYSQINKTMYNISTDEKIDMLVNFYKQNGRLPNAKSTSHKEKSLRYFLNNARHGMINLTEEQENKLLSIDPNFNIYTKVINSKELYSNLVKFILENNRLPRKYETYNGTKIGLFARKMVSGGEKLTEEEKREIFNSVLKEHGYKNNNIDIEDCIKEIMSNKQNTNIKEEYSFYIIDKSDKNKIK